MIELLSMIVLKTAWHFVQAKCSLCGGLIWSRCPSNLQGIAGVEKKEKYNNDDVKQMMMMLFRQT